MPKDLFETSQQMRPFWRQHPDITINPSMAKLRKSPWMTEWRTSRTPQWNGYYLTPIAVCEILIVMYYSQNV